MQRLMRRVFNVLPGEGATVLVLLLFIFFIQSVLSTGKILQYAIFLDGFGKRSLALAFILAPLVLAVVAATYSALTRLVPSRRLVPATLGALAAGFVIWRLALGPEPPDFPTHGGWIPEPVPDPVGPFFLYIWVEVAASIAIVQGWAFVSDVFHPRQAKRLIPLVGLGASLSFLLNGFVVNPVVRWWINAEELAWVVVGALLSAVALFGVARRRGLGRDREPRARGARPDAQGGFVASLGRGFGQISRTPLLRLFALITVATIITQGLLDYLFMNELRARFDKNALAGFYALFFGVLGALQVVFQMFLSGRLITRLGSVFCLTILPIAVALAGLAYVLLPLFWLLVGLRFGDRLLKQAFYSPSLQALYTPVPKVAKRQAMTLIKGVISPLSFAAFGVVLFFVGTHLALRWVALGLVVVASASAALMIVKARPAYVQALSRALERRRFEHDELVEDFAVALDGETLAFIQTAVFEEEDEGKAVFALRLLSGARSPQVRELLFRACAHPSPQVRREASALIAEMGQRTDAEAVAALLPDEPDPDVLAQHLLTLTALGAPSTAAPAVAEPLRDPRPRVRASAVCCALRLGLGSDTVEAQFDALCHGDEPTRTELARALQAFAHEDLAPRCAVLLRDDAEPVRGAALRAAAAIASETLLEDVLACFQERGPRDEAGYALSALGDAAVPALGRIARDPDAPLALRQRVPKLLATVDTDRAGAVLEELLGDASEEIRYYTIRSLARITHHPGGYGAPPRALLLQRVHAEVVHGHLLGTLRRGLSSRADPQRASLLYQELGHRYQHGLARIFGLASMLEEPKLAAIVHWNLQSGDPRLVGNAIELMDTAFCREVAALTVPLVEDQQRTVDLARAFPEAAEGLREAITEPVRHVLRQGDPWLRVCAAVGWPEAVRREDPALHAEVQTMLPLIEKILFLQSVPIFRELSGEELHFIAGITEEVSVARGAVICHQGDPGDAMFLVLAGSVSVQVGGQEILRLGKSEVVGEMAVLDNLPRSADVLAAEDTELLRIDAQSFDELLQDKHQIVKGIFKVLSSRLRQSTARRVTDREMRTVADPADAEPPSDAPT